jgi:hypothetical protein
MIAALVLSAAFHRLPPVRAAKNAGAYVALGDSISNSPDTAGGPIWPVLLSRLLPSLPYVNLALPGVTSAYIRTTELAAVPSGCALVTLEAGANDYEREPWVNFQTFGTQLRGTLDVLHFSRCPDARIVVLTYVNDYPAPDPRHAAFERLNAYVRGLPRTRPWVTVVDLDADARFHPFPGSPLMYNAIHENGAGQYVIAADVAAVL